MYWMYWNVYTWFRWFSVWANLAERCVKERGAGTGSRWFSVWATKSSGGEV